MSISLSGNRPMALSPPPLSVLSESDRSSAAPSPAGSPSSSRTSVNILDSSVSSWYGWVCCAAINRLAQSGHFSASRYFAVLNFWWVLCSAFCWVFHNKLCNFFFRCGCTWNWAGSWDRCAEFFRIFPFVEHSRHHFLRRCNVHNARGPRCPWCAAPSGECHMMQRVSYAGNP